MVRVAILHPDLGLGGAERLIVDVARALQDEKHQVTIYTGHHNRGHCFQETRDGTLSVHKVGSWMPRSILGRCYALMAYLRMIYIAFYLILWSRHDLIICDQVSACIPIIRLFDIFNKPKILFYCHFPDQLLTTRESLMKTIYRCPIDWFEEFSTRMADQILVNSNFTSRVVKRTFRSLKERDLTVIYPCVDVDKLASHKEDIQTENFTFLSLNRFERKKNLALAIEAFNECLKSDKKLFGQCRLIIAGGYDGRLKDCVAYTSELESMVKDLKLAAYVSFEKSPTDEDKFKLLNLCDVVLYTPEHEHFGIVPLEAMAMSKPIIACASGGPLETIEPNVSGFLCEPNKNSFAKAMLGFLKRPESSMKMGKKGFDRVMSHFSYYAFRNRLNRCL